MKRRTLSRPALGKGAPLPTVNVENGSGFLMICPHCNRTIREEEQYLMSRDPNAAWPSWGKYGIYLLLFVLLVGAFSLHAHF
jgi:hypothetical protein